MLKTIYYWVILLVVIFAAYQLKDFKNYDIYATETISPSKNTYLNSKFTQYSGICTFQNKKLVKDKYRLFHIDPESNNNIVLIIGDVFYTWNQGETTGIKMNIENSTNEKKQKMLEQVDIMLKPVVENTYTCENRGFIEGYFRIPDDVSFIDISMFLNKSF